MLTPTGNFGNMIIVNTKTPKQTLSLGKTIGQLLAQGGIIALRGNLGSGKTTFTKGLAQGLKVRQTITSPTFVIFKIYKTEHRQIKQLVHADCYRLSSSQLKFTGLADWFSDPKTLVVIEWSEKIKQLPRGSMIIEFKKGRKDSERVIKIKD